MNSKALEKGKQLQPIVIRQSKIDLYASKIDILWNKTLKSIFAVGDLLIAAKDELERKEYLILINKLRFGPRVAERLVKIAKDERLRLNTLQEKLPACWTILDELRRLSKRDFQKAKKLNLITPALTRSDVRLLKSEKRCDHSRAQTANLATTADNQSKVRNNPTLVFEMPDELDNYKVALDVYFIAVLVQTLFSNVPGKQKVHVTMKGLRPSKKILDSYDVLQQLIEKVREVDNHQRKHQKRGCPINR